MIQKHYGWTDEEVYALPFHRVWTSYHLTQFEETKQHNEGRFGPSVITYMLSNMFRGADTPALPYERHAETMGIISPKLKATINKDDEVAKSNKTMELFLGKPKEKNE